MSASNLNPSFEPPRDRITTSVGLTSMAERPEWSREFEIDLLCADNPAETPIALQSAVTPVPATEAASVANSVRSVAETCRVIEANVRVLQFTRDQELNSPDACDRKHESPGVPSTQV